jgi:hypothetical protein
MKYLRLLIIIAAASVVSSCATILTGTTQRVTVDSTPPGAGIIIDGYYMGNTPARLRLDRDVNALIENGKDIQLELAGYYPDGYFLGTDIEPTTILNVLFPFGFALDAVSGALMKYDSEYYHFNLVPLVEQDPVSADEAKEIDNYEKLMKLVELYEAGMLTEEEFEAEKAKLFENQ